MQTATEIFNQVKKKVLPRLENHSKDLTVKDYKTIVTNNYTGPFIHCSRSTGTHILLLGRDIEAMIKEEWLKKQCGTESDIREDMREDLKKSVCFITNDCNKHFLHFDGKRLRKITQQEAKELYLNHIDRICNAWKRKIPEYSVSRYSESQRRGVAL